MFVLERSGVTWSKRFYTGRSYLSPEPQWGPLAHAHKFDTHSQAKKMSYQIDGEGFYTFIERVQYEDGELVHFTEPTSDEE